MPSGRVERTATRVWIDRLGTGGGCAGPQLVQLARPFRIRALAVRVSSIDTRKMGPVHSPSKAARAFSVAVAERSRLGVYSVRRGTHRQVYASNHNSTPAAGGETPRKQRASPSRQIRAKLSGTGNWQTRSSPNLSLGDVDREHQHDPRRARAATGQRPAAQAPRVQRPAPRGTAATAAAPPSDWLQTRSGTAACVSRSRLFLLLLGDSLAAANLHLLLAAHLLNLGVALLARLTGEA